MGRCQKWCLFILEIRFKTSSLLGKDSRYQKTVCFPGVGTQKRMTKISPHLVPNLIAPVASLLLTITSYSKAKTSL